MENKKIYTIVGVLAGAGLIYYFWKKSKSSDVEESKEEVKEKKADIPKGEKAQILRVKENFQARKEVKPISFDIELEEKKFFVEDKASETPAIEKGTGIKGLKGSDRKDFRKDTRATCEEKFGSGKDYRQCKRRVKGGGIPFEGDFDEFEKDYMDFEGVGSYSSFQSQFDIDL